VGGKKGEWRKRSLKQLGEARVATFVVYGGEGRKGESFDCVHGRKWKKKGKKFQKYQKKRLARRGNVLRSKLRGGGWRRREHAIQSAFNECGRRRGDRRW